MAAKCDVCRKMAKKYTTTSSGDIVCSKACMDSYRLESRLLGWDKNRENEVSNKNDLLGLQSFKVGKEKYI